ncbi:MAG: TonB-dependent receptor [Deltaproteobacteria bacterium]|nr:TonB-dependent receptor [Deltaproteobacteria bacterium]
MRRAAKYLYAVAGLALGWGAAAPAYGQPAPPAPDGLTDEDLQKLAEGDVIEIFDERPDKPFDRDTEVRLTGEQLAARGATDLGTALAMLNDISVRDAGRGGFNIDIRGARKGAVTVLIDGVLVTDPYYGTFDVSTIPITDIVQIRVSTTPQSPIDGPGGPGGVIEVLTRDAIGEQIVIARLTSDSLPSLGVTATARAPLAKHLAIRISASGVGGARELDLPGGVSIGEARHSATGAGRLEYRKGDRRIAADGFLDDRHYVSPPSDTTRSSILMIDRETSVRGALKADEKIGKLQLQGGYYGHYLHRRSRYFADPELTNQQQSENLSAIRSGGYVLATKPFLKDFRWAGSASISHEKALASNQVGEYVRGDVTMLEIAADLQYERKRVRLDGAIGLATPFGVGADPWPEGKLVAKLKARQDLEITATAAFKGRVPSLRERFDAQNGNPSLGPEKAAHAELRAVATRDRFKLELAPFFKHTTGTVRASAIAADMGKLVNLGRVNFWGVDTTARVTVDPHLDVGGSYNYVKANADTTGDDPLDRLPHHRFDVWAEGRIDKRFSGRVRAKYFGYATEKGMRIPGYLLFEANLTAQITKEYLAVFRIDDALDEAPETRAGYHLPGRVFSLVLQGAWK